FPLDRLAERMISSLSFIRRLMAKIRHLQAASDAERHGTLSSETLVVRDNYDTIRREWIAMCRHWGQRVQSLERARTDSENFLRQGHRVAEYRHQARIAELTDQVAQLQAQLRDSEAARQAAERRAEERVLDVNALVDFLMGNKPKINVMFNWVRLSALLHHFAEGTPIPEGWLTNINVVALDDPRCECPKYVKPSPRPSNGDSSSGSSRPRRPSVLDLSPPARNKRASTSGSRTGGRKRKASGARDVPLAKQAGRALPDGMLWTDVRADVQHLLLSGMDFKCAMKWVSENQGIHHLAPREAVCQMLTQVIYAGQLDETPWCRFVQKRKQSTQETEALQAKLPESSDDEVQDPSYELSRAELDKAAQAEAAADNDESSAESDGAEPESKPATSHPSPAGPRESKTQKKSDKGSNSKSPGASSKFQYRSTKSPKSRVLPKSG
ncbi:hypothetical protein PHMEG_00033328, partial [Phytophthora megakarya]